jgi:apolipoprotein N-acyltransferase
MSRYLLSAGVALIVLTGPRWGVAPLAWLAPVPLLLWARQAHGTRSWAGLFGVLLAGYAAQCAIFATSPVPVIGVIGFAPPLALLRFSAIAASEAVRRRLGERAGLVSYVAVTVAGDWVGYGASEFGAWMATANSQVEWLPFMQVTAIAGLAGAGALMAWASGAIAAAIGASPAVWSSQRRAGVLAAPALVVTAVIAWGNVRLDQPVAGPSVSVAAVVTSLGMTEQGLPARAALERNTEELFSKTRIAASRGARLVVWNEIATVIQPADEAGLIDRGRKTARELGIDLILAYGVLQGSDRILFDNKYTFISDGGEILDEYRKHHPVPGEPSIRGTEPIRVIDRPYGRVGGAICYDYDFPALAREHARQRADLVVVPSSDWRGIDPIHTYMARTRAIEGGFALLRSVRWAPSGAFDALGRTRAWMSALDDTDGVMVARLPLGRMPAPAQFVGDTPVIAAALTAGLMLFLAFRVARGKVRPAAYNRRSPWRSPQEPGSVLTRS